MDLVDFGEEGQVKRTKSWFCKLECREPAIIEEPAHANAASVRHKISTSVRCSSNRRSGGRLLAMT